MSEIKPDYYKNYDNDLFLRFKNGLLTKEEYVGALSDNKDEQTTITAKLELDTTDAENKIKAIHSELGSLDVYLSNYSNFKYKLDLIKAFAWGASVGAAMFVLVIIACGRLGWIKYLN